MATTPTQLQLVYHQGLAHAFYLPTNGWIQAIVEAADGTFSKTQLPGLPSMNVAAWPSALAAVDTPDGPVLTVSSTEVYRAFTCMPTISPVRWAISSALQTDQTPHGVDVAMAVVGDAVYLGLQIANGFQGQERSPWGLWVWDGARQDPYGWGGQVDCPAWVNGFALGETARGLAVGFASQFMTGGQDFPYDAFLTGANGQGVVQGAFVQGVDGQATLCGLIDGRPTAWEVDGPRPPANSYPSYPLMPALSEKATRIAGATTPGGQFVAALVGGKVCTAERRQKSESWSVKTPVEFPTDVVDLAASSTTEGPRLLFETSSGGLVLAAQMSPDTWVTQPLP
jgi:hypothetical protein